MSLDARARSAADELRGTAPAAVETAGLMQALPRRVEARRTQRRAGAAVAALLLLAAVGGFALGRVSPATVIQPAGQATPSPSYSPCGSSTVLCQGGRTYRVTLPVPVTLTLPASFQDNIQDTMLNVQAFDGDGSRGGVTIMEGALPLLADGSPASKVHATAQGYAAWLAKRPFVVPTTVKPVTVGGLDGYRVDVVIRPGAELPASKAGGPAAMTFESDGWTAAVSDGLHHATYYVLDAPRGDIVLIWSWTNGGEVSDLTRNAKLIDTLRFG